MGEQSHRISHRHAIEQKDLQLVSKENFHIREESKL
jgi:hypothetical protein